MAKSVSAKRAAEKERKLAEADAAPKPRPRSRRSSGRLKCCAAVAVALVSVAFVLFFMFRSPPGPPDGLLKRSPKEPPAPAPSPLEAALWTDFVAWLHAGGAEVQRGVRTGLMPHGGEFVRGLVSDELLPRGTVLLRIPQKLWFAETLLPDLEPFPEAEVNGCNYVGTPMEQTLKFAAAAVLELKKGKESFFAPFMNMSPKLSDYHTFHPYLADESVREDFSELPIINFLTKVKDSELEAHKRCFETWKALPDSPVADLDWEADMKEGIFESLTRGHYLLRSLYRFPGLELANTAPITKVNANMDLSHPGYVELKANSDIPAGDEILIHYCEEACDNEKLLSIWGVYMEDNWFAHNTDLPVKCSPGLRRVTEAMIDLGGISVASDASWTAPRCQRKAVESTDQGPLRCSLARLAWEKCAGEWTPGVWQDRTPVETSGIKLHSMAHNTLGVTALSTGDVTGAKKAFRAAVKTNPAYAEPYGNLGLIYKEFEKDWASSAKYFRASLKVEPMVAELHVQLGHVLKEQGDTKGAEHSYREGLRYKPTMTNVLTELAVMLQMRGDLDGAVDSFREAIQLEPDVADWHFDLGRILQSQSDFDGAMESYETAIRINPTDAEVAESLKKAQQLSARV